MPFTFIPSPEPAGPNAFITDDPQVLMETGQFNHVPYITGINQMEGMITLKRELKNSNYQKSFIEDFIFYPNHYFPPPLTIRAKT